MIIKKVFIDYSQWNGSISSTEYNIINKEELESLKEKLKKFTNKEKLLPGEKVFFTKEVTFPKRKFKEKFPDNKIVYDASKADVVILDGTDIEESLQRLYFNEYYVCGTNRYTRDKNHPNITSTKEKIALLYRSDISDKLTTVGNFTGKMVMDSKNLTLPSEEKIDVEAYEKFGKMLKATEASMLEMAMNLLTAYDYNTERNKIAMLLFENWDHISGFRIKTNIEIKSMLKKLNNEYGDFRKRYRGNSNKFWFRMILNSPTDAVTVKAFNKWIRTQVDVDGNTQLILTPINIES